MGGVEEGGHVVLNARADYEIHSEPAVSFSVTIQNSLYLPPSLSRVCVCVCARARSRAKLSRPAFQRSGSIPLSPRALPSHDGLP